jgi:uracil-xanthine permease
MSQDPSPDPTDETPDPVGEPAGEVSGSSEGKGEPAPEASAEPVAAASGESKLLYGIDDVPPPAETLALGFQHYLTMFGSTVAIPLILAPAFGIQDKPQELVALMGTMFFISGITTLLQTTWGNRLPIVQGGTFSFLGPTFAICGMAGVADAADWQVRIQHVQGAIILGALVEIVMGLTGVAGRVLRYVGPITIAPTIALIGLALYPFGAANAGQDWWIGGLTILLIVLFSQVLRKKHRAFELYPIMLAILVAWGVAAIGTAAGWFGEGHPSRVSLDNVRNAAWISIPTPFQWGWPQFTAAAFVGMIAGYMASVVESIGDYFACARLAGAPTPDQKTVNRGITFEGLGCLIAGVFGTGNGTTSYSENIGAIGLTRVGSRRVVQAGALIMLVLGGVGKFGALFTTIPGPIVGGMYCALFGMIAAVGLSNLQLVDLNSSRNLFILGFAFFMGLSVPVYFKDNAVQLTPGPTLVERAMADDEPITADPDALGVLGAKPDATAGDARALEAALDEVHSGQPASDPARAEGRDKALATITTPPPTPPERTTWFNVLSALQDIVNTLGTSGMAVGAFLALFLDNVIPGTDRERGLAHMMAEGT